MTADKNDVLHNLSVLGDAISSGIKALHKAIKAEQNAEILDKLPPKVLKRVDVLKQMQSEQDELKAKYLEERRALEEKYQKLYQPLYTKRYDIVNGVAGVDGVSDELADQVDDKPAEEKGVPSFWLIAMKTNIVLGDWIQKHDEEALKYLKDIKWCRIEVPKDNNKKVETTEGFKLEFFFDTNPFFKNSVLTKTYLIIDEDVPVLERAIGTEIEWFPGKCLTEILKKPPKKGSKNAKPITETETLDSFFNFFTPPEVLDNEEEIEDDVLDELESLMEQDYDVGLTIRNRIIPHAVTWFTGEAALYEMSGDLEDEDDDDDEDEREDNKEEEHEDEDEAEDDEDDDEDDENEDEGDEDDKKTSSQKKVKLENHRAATKHENARLLKAQGEAQQAAEKPPECKQQ